MRRKYTKGQFSVKAAAALGEPEMKSINLKPRKQRQETEILRKT